MTDSAFTQLRTTFTWFAVDSLPGGLRQMKAAHRAWVDNRDRSRYTETGKEGEANWPGSQYWRNGDAGHFACGDPDKTVRDCLRTTMAGGHPLWKPAISRHAAKSTIAMLDDHNEGFKTSLPDAHNRKRRLLASPLECSPKPHGLTVSASLSL